ncbi:flavodoxin [Acholeplasma granularum]|uniref:flavodoxin n=1 Tax=Acholeplasma granularum TaxID=264635 RepID=UPI00046F0BB5|nr:flavodoxin [Acholeplasma granularum]
MAILVVYWSGTGNTEVMAQNIYDGIIEAGVECDLKQIDEVLPDDILDYDKIAIGCPSMGIEELEPEEFLPWYEDVEPLLGDKPLLLFGSYGWGEGEWMDYWQDRVNDLGLNLFEEGIKIASMPSRKESEEIKLKAKRFAEM